MGYRRPKTAPILHSDRHTSQGGLELQNIGADGVQEDLVVRHHQQDAAEALGQPLLQPYQRVQVQVVRGLEVEL